MRQRTLRHLIYTQILETPHWVRDTVLGLVAGGLAVASWMVVQPALAPAPAVRPIVLNIPIETPDQREAQSLPTHAPLLWRAERNGNTVYLFGSIHVMKPSLNWMDKRLFQAFDSADAAWFEVPDLDSLPHFTGFDRNVMAKTPVLTNGLTDEEKYELETIINRYDMTLKDVARVKPGAMAGFVSQLDVAGSNYSFNQGVDMTLFHRAKELKKSVDGFENNKLHYSYLYRLGADMGGDGTAALKQALANHFGRGNMAGDINVMVSTWRDGDQKALTDGVLGQRAANPRFYDVLLVQRNQLWLPRIEGLLESKKPQSTFITVGMAHLIGPDGLVAQMRAKGYTVERVEF
jgi:uncharacterized protein YbaP (TraB family)